MGISLCELYWRPGCFYAETGQSKTAKGVPLAALLMILEDWMKRSDCLLQDLRYRKDIKKTSAGCYKSLKSLAQTYRPIRYIMQGPPRRQDQTTVSSQPSKLKNSFKKSSSLYKRFTASSSALAVIRSGRPNCFSSAARRAPLSGPPLRPSA